MKIEQLPSGSYRIRQMYQGKTYSVVVPYKPTQKDALILLSEKMSRVPVKADRRSFEVACNDYIDAKKNVLSPRSVREYKLYINRLPKWFIDENLNDITQETVQRCVNELSSHLAPKTVRSLHGFISSVLGLYRADLRLSTTLPQKVKNEPYIPTQEDVKRILEFTMQNQPKFYVPIALASSCGLRRSEILALQVDDIYDGEIHIHSALVEDEDGKWVTKTTKTTLSTRSVPISPDLEKYIREQGYVYRGGTSSISRYLVRVEHILGIEEFSIHKLRHFFASQLLSNGVPMKDVQALGGWETDTTLKEVYAHAMKTRTKEGRTQITQTLWKSIF